MDLNTFIKIREINRTDLNENNEFYIISGYISEKKLYKLFYHHTSRTYNSFQTFKSIINTILFENKIVVINLKDGTVGWTHPKRKNKI